MPVAIKKTDKGYTTSTPGGVKGRGMTLRNAKRQKRLLNAIKHSHPASHPARRGEL